jgi:formamidopyrimidine-DNA glycosylase
MPESAETRLMKEAICEICEGKYLKQITVLGGRYKPYMIKDENGQWISKLINLETGRFNSIDPKKHPGGEYRVELENLEEINALLAEQKLGCPRSNIIGKFCWIDLAPTSQNSNLSWYIGLTFGMSGSIFYEPTETVLQQYMSSTGKKITKGEYMKNFHIKFELNDGSCFYFGDVRRFGTVTISDNRQKLAKKLATLGHDILNSPPLSDQEVIASFRKSPFCNQNICKVIMDQDLFSGPGNYIKAESLYENAISPWALVSDLDDSTLIGLYKSLREIAQNAYTGHGASLYSYTGTRREKGTFQELLKIYGKLLDPLGNKVVTITDTIKSNLLPDDKRTIHYVPVIQIKGDYRDPNLEKNRKPKIKIELKN